LVIVDWRTKAITIGKYLGRVFDVMAWVGLVRDLPTRVLGVDVDLNFDPMYVTIKGKTKTLADIKKAARTASRIFLATDPDREGEAIAWHVAGQLETKAPIHRVLFEEITKTGVERAMAHPQHIDDKKVEAQQARRILDRLVGYKASPILWPPGRRSGRSCRTRRTRCGERRGRRPCPPAAPRAGTGRWGGPTGGGAGRR
jgi:DNA topoisomerase-1